MGCSVGFPSSCYSTCFCCYRHYRLNSSSSRLPRASDDYRYENEEEGEEDEQKLRFTRSVEQEINWLGRL